jgi:hypothetical protein
MQGRVKHRRKKVTPQTEGGFTAYLRRLTPLALWFLPFWLVLPFIVDPGRIDLVLSGTVAKWKFLLWAAFIVFVSFLSSASSDWDDRRKARKSERR